MIGLPTMSYIHTYLAITIMSWLTDAKVGLRLYPTLNVTPVDEARNCIVEEFMNGEAKDCTHLLFIDADTIPPQDALYKLLSHDKDIVSGLTPIIDYHDKDGTFYRKWNCSDMNERLVKPNTGLVPIKGAGGSCLLIKREVFEKLEKPYFRFLYKDDNNKPIIVSEDIYFITKAFGAGFQVYADTSVICKHHKSIVW